MRCAGVEPVTEHSFLLFCSDSAPVMSVLSARTSSFCPVIRYGPAKSTFSLRASVIEYVAAMKSTWSFWIRVSRWPDGASFHSIWSSL